MTHPIWGAPLRALPGGRSTRAAPPAWARAEVRTLDTLELLCLRSALARALSELPLNSPGSTAIGALSRAVREELALRELRRLSGLAARARRLTTPRARRARNIHRREASHGLRLPPARHRAGTDDHRRARRDGGRRALPCLLGSGLHHAPSEARTATRQLVDCQTCAGFGVIGGVTQAQGEAIATLFEGDKSMFELLDERPGHWAIAGSGPER